MPVDCDSDRAAMQHDVSQQNLAPFSVDCVFVSRVTFRARIVATLSYVSARHPTGSRLALLAIVLFGCSQSAPREERPSRGERAGVGVGSTEVKLKPSEKIGAERSQGIENSRHYTDEKSIAIDGRLPDIVEGGSNDFDRSTNAIPIRDQVSTARFPIGEREQAARAGYTGNITNIASGTYNSMLPNGPPRLERPDESDEAYEARRAVDERLRKHPKQVVDRRGYPRDLQIKAELDSLELCDAALALLHQPYHRESMWMDKIAVLRLLKRLGWEGSSEALERTRRELESSASIGEKRALCWWELSDAWSDSVARSDQEMRRLIDSCVSMIEEDPECWLLARTAVDLGKWITSKHPGLQSYARDAILPLCTRHRESAALRFWSKYLDAALSAVPSS